MAAKATSGGEAKGKSGNPEWNVCSLYFESLEAYFEEALVDILKISARTTKMKNAPIPSISNAAFAAKDALQKDPYNMKLINNLGHLYWKEGQHEQCFNVMMRGWKRAGEIPDPTVRLHFLMKLAELSMGLWKYRQGLAIWRDIEEPSDPKQLKSYLLLGTQLWCNNGDLQQSLKHFQRCVDGEPYNAAIRIFGVMVLDLKKVGGYEAARSTLESLQPNGHLSELSTLDAFVQQVQERKKVLTPDQAKNRFIYATVAVCVFLFLGVLYHFESQSLAALKDGKA